MDQRTCNIIMCCKNHCKLPKGKDQDKLTAVAAYMSEECGCPIEIYTGATMESIMKDALFDYINGARNPGSDLRRLFERPLLGPEPSLSERIATMFALVNVREYTPIGKSGGNMPYDNGFTEALIAQSRIDLGETTTEE